MFQIDRLDRGLLESHSHIVLIQFGMTFQCRPTLDINLVLFILLSSRIFLIFMIVHVLIFITPDTHTVWELITPNDKT